MENELVTVIMSAYNESEEELVQSIQSILNQTYRYLEFIIVNDNPNNPILNKVLSKINDPRVNLIHNSENQGLVFSLNRAIKLARGTMIARMDADDISVCTRIEEQVRYMNVNQFHMVGSYLELIDEHGNTLRKVMRFPTTTKRVKKYIPFGSCIAHPTWLVQKELYTRLQGYRTVPHCEDYDFILRAVQMGCNMGNMPSVGLKYRIRKNSISKTNDVEQYLLRLYLSHHRKSILELTEQAIQDYIASAGFEQEKQRYLLFEALKQEVKDTGSGRNALSFLNLLKNRYLYYNLLEKVTLKLRER